MFFIISGHYSSSLFVVLPVFVLPSYCIPFPFTYPDAVIADICPPEGFSLVYGTCDIVHESTLAVCETHCQLVHVDCHDFTAQKGEDDILIADSNFQSKHHST